VGAHVRVRHAGCVALSVKYDRVISRYSTTTTAAATMTNECEHAAREMEKFIALRRA